MNFINLPIFILLFAFVYLSIVYGLLKMAEAQKQAENIVSNNIVSNNVQDASQRVKTP